MSTTAIIAIVVSGVGLIIFGILIFLYIAHSRKKKEKKISDGGKK